MILGMQIPCSDSDSPSRPAEQDIYPGHDTPTVLDCQCSVWWAEIFLHVDHDEASPHRLFHFGDVSEMEGSRFERLVVMSMIWKLWCGGDMEA